MGELQISRGLIAILIDVTTDSLCPWIAKKNMLAHRVGRLWKFKVTEVDDWVRSEGTHETRKRSPKGVR